MLMITSTGIGTAPTLRLQIEATTTSTTSTPTISRCAARHGPAGLRQARCRGAHAMFLARSVAKRKYGAPISAQMTPSGVS